MLTGVTIRNTDQEPITITGIRVSWSPDDGEIIREVAFTRGWCGRSPHAGFTAFWPGEAESGPVLEGQAQPGTVTQGDSAQSVRLSFDSNVERRQIVCTAILDDGSEKAIRLDV